MTDDIEMNLRSSRRSETSSEFDIISSIFDRYSDRQGWIAVKHLEEIVKKQRNHLSDRVIRRLVTFADSNRDGSITKEELKNLFKTSESEIAISGGFTKKDVNIFKKTLIKAGNFVLTNEEDKYELYHQKYSCAIPPIFMFLISVAELSVYIYYSATYGEWLNYPLEIITSPIIFYPPLRNEAWRFLSYMFLHAGIEHIFFNLIFQLFLGVPLEMVHGPLRVGAIYLSGVLAGSMASSVFEPAVALVGASGGVYALLTAQLANVILNGDIMSKIGSLLRTIIVLVLLLADFGYAIYRRLEDIQDKSRRVSIVAHIAGFLAGITIGLMVLRNFKKFPREKVLFWIAVGIYIVFMIFGIFWNAFWPHYPDE